jgi:hypothetical protein
MELASCHHSGAYNFEVALRFLKKIVFPLLYIATRSLRYRTHTHKVKCVYVLWEILFHNRAIAFMRPTAVSRLIWRYVSKEQVSSEEVAKDCENVPKP